MRIPRIHIPAPLTCGTTVALTDSAANHVTRVLRLKPGASLILFNGEGGEYQATLASVDKRGASATVGAYDPREAESPLPLRLVQGISRGERMDYTLQKAVELGVGEIVPVLSERSVVDLRGERLDKRMRHWEGVIIGACEQCGRNRIPTLIEAQPLHAWLQQAAPAGLRLVLSHRAARPLTACARPDAVTLLIGPEGGLSETELSLADAAGYTRVVLGPRVLRTETAALTALAAIQTLWGDFAV